LLCFSASQHSGIFLNPGTINPPGGALALLYIATPALHALGWWYILIAIMNVSILVVVGFLAINIPRAMQYPTSWI